MNMRKRLFTLFAFTLFFCLSSFLYSEEINTDVNADGVVNILDLVQVANAFGQPVSDENAAADVNADGEINILDLVQVANDLGKSTVPSEPSDAPASITNEDVVSEPVAPDENTEETLVVGIALPVTGHLAATGEIMKSGFDLAFDELAGLSYIIADDKSTAEGAVAAFEELIHKQGVSVILGPASSSSAGAAFPIAQENGIVALSATAGARGLSEIGDYVFQLPPKGDVWIAAGVKATQTKLGYTRVAQLYDRADLFSTDRADTFAQTFEAEGIEVVATQRYETGDTDFAEQLNRIKALTPDAVFVSALPPEKPKILTQARELGLSMHFIITSLTETDVAAAGAAAEGAITFTSWLITDNTPKNRVFVEQYRKVYGTDPTGFVVYPYVATNILAEAINNAQSTDAGAIKDALLDIKDIETIIGQFSFDENGSGVYDPMVSIVQDGILQPFPDPD